MKYQKVIDQKIEKDIEFIRPVRGVVSMIDDKLLFAMKSFEHGFKQFPGVWSLRILENFS